jgi:hypothetical protein
MLIEFPEVTILSVTPEKSKASFYNDHNGSPLSAALAALLTRRKSICITKMCGCPAQTTLLSESPVFLDDPPKESKRGKGQ